MSPNVSKMILSIDVEDWFHLLVVDAAYQFRSRIVGIESWKQFTPRIEGSTHWILDLLDRYNMKATFFILGWVAERQPQLVKEINCRGHEVASHGYGHRLIYTQTPEEFLEDLRRSVGILESIIGEKVLGFRASSASITQWALDILAQEGILYDSSVFPATYHDLYGKIGGLDPSLPIERLPNGLWEVKMSSLRIGKAVLPWGGGGYFRLIPFGLFKWGAARIQRDQGLYQFYLHPWELDPEAPRLDDLKPMYYFRRYCSIRKTRNRFERFLGAHEFSPVRDVLSAWIVKEQDNVFPKNNPCDIGEEYAL